MLVCTECYTSEGPLQLSFSAAVSALLFEGWAARLVVIYKDQHEQRLAETCAALLDAAIPQQWLSWADAATYIPADASKVRERGFDHMRLLCQHLARRLGLAWRDCLVKNASGDQRRLNREQRAENLAEAFSHTGRQGIEGKRLLLIDDVYTTGATLHQAAAALLGAGAAEVRVATVCRVY
jgi:ComF family protein